jgi:hypothetical protein
MATRSETLKELGIDGCWHCGRDQYKTTIARVSFAFNIYHADLCASCENDVTAGIDASDLWDQRQALEARGGMLHAMTCADGKDRTADLIELQNEARELNQQLFSLIKTLVHGEVQPCTS